MNSESKISIITPVFNCATFLSETILSVKAQTFKNWELILIDDFSDDDSLKIARTFEKADKRIRVIVLSENAGPAGARNKGIEEANGRYISFLDSDDLWLPEKLERQLSFMTEHTAAFSFCQVQRFSENGQILGVSVVPEQVDYYGLLKSNVVVCSSAMYDTHQLGKVLMPEIRKRQDYGLWLKILKLTSLGYGLRQVLVQYRVREGSVSANKRIAAAYTWQIYRHVEKLSLPRAVYYFCCYAISGLLRVKWPGLAKKLGLLQ